MNEHNEFEAELAALRPIAPSAELKQRIAQRLEEPVIPASGRRSRGPLWLAAICGPIAAVLAFFLLSGGKDKTDPVAEPSDGATQSITATAFDNDLPSLWSYRRAVGQPFAELDTLLDKHAQHSTEPKPQRAGALVSVFARSDSQLEDLLGEL